MQHASAISPWLQDVGERAPRLCGELRTQVAIVGAGFTGLSSALALRREGLDVALLEARFAGYGASGRNAGHLTPTIGKDIPTLLRIYGEARALELVRLADLAVGHVAGLIESLAIDCDYEPVGNVIAAVHPRQFRAIDRAAEAAARCRLPGQLLEAKDMEARGLPRRFLRGFLEAHGGILDPGKYVRGLRRAAVSAGARLFEDTPVLRIEPEAPARLHTPEGRVIADHVVLASNAFTPALGWLSSAALPLWVQLFQTERLSTEELNAVGWRGREGIYTAHEVLESYRLTADQRIVGGAKAVRYGFAGRTLPDCDARIAQKLEDTFRARFPELASVRVARHWGGPIFMSLDFLPVVGRTGRHKNLLHAVAYAGHGIALASYGGEMIADLLLDRAGPGAALWQRRRVPLPPEPLRWLTFHALHGLLSGLDRRVDRRISD